MFRRLFGMGILFLAIWGLFYQLYSHGYIASMWMVTFTILLILAIYGWRQMNYVPPVEVINPDGTRVPQGREEPILTNQQGLWLGGAVLSLAVFLTLCNYLAGAYPDLGYALGLRRVQTDVSLGKAVKPYSAEYNRMLEHLKDELRVAATAEEQAILEKLIKQHQNGDMSREELAAKIDAQARKTRRELERIANMGDADFNSTTSGSKNRPLFDSVSISVPDMTEMGLAPQVFDTWPAWKRTLYFVLFTLPILLLLKVILRLSKESGVKANSIWFAAVVIAGLYFHFAEDFRENKGAAKVVEGVHDFFTEPRAQAAPIDNKVCVNLDFLTHDRPWYDTRVIIQPGAAIRITKFWINVPNCTADGCVTAPHIGPNMWHATWPQYMVVGAVGNLVFPIGSKEEIVRPELQGNLLIGINAPARPEDWVNMEGKFCYSIY